MKYIKLISNTFLAGLFMMMASCADNTLEVEPLVENYPFRLILDTDEGGDLADAEDYALEVKFADFIGDLPTAVVTVDYEISDLTDDMTDNVFIDAIIAEVDDEEYELDFTASGDGLTGIIAVNLPDGSVPEAFEVVFKLPGEEEVFYASGSFKFSLSNLQAGGANIILGTPYEFEYEVLDHELAGSWKMEITNEEELDAFKEIFGPINADLNALEFSDVMGGESIEVEFEFEFGEMKIVLVYLDLDGEEVEIEIEADYDFDDGELELEGSHVILGDDGEPEDELDFIIEAEYTIEGDILAITFLKVIDEDNFKDGEELYAGSGVSVLEKD
ncbi:hypothetical protein QQ054_16745 [Oscillatoria amoena NRMC-F 0135]|nr:hypothetical protein [Oscillatoria amoena NRMC-F 0135]